MAKETLKAFLEKSELRKREIFFSEEGNEVEPFSANYQFENGYSMLVKFERKMDGTPFSQSILYLNGESVDVSDKEYRHTPVFANSHNGNCFSLREYMKWPAFRYFSSGEIKMLKKGDAVRIVVTVDGTIKNGIVKEVTEKYMCFQTVNKEEEFPTKLYGEVWRLAPPTCGLHLSSPLKDACHIEAVWRLNDAGFDNDSVAALAPMLREELLEEVIFVDGDAITHAMKKIAKEYLDSTVTESCKELLMECSYDIWTATKKAKANLWQEVKQMTDSQKMIFCYVVGIDNQDRAEEIMVGKTIKDGSFRFIEVTLWPEQKKLLRDEGYFIYDLRDGEGQNYSIDTCATVNNIGNWVTDTDITPLMHEGRWLDRDEFDESMMLELPYSEIEKILDLGRKIHSAKERENAIFAKVKDDILKVVKTEEDWFFVLSDTEGNIKKQGYTAYRDLSMYPGKNEIIYILEYCLDIPGVEYVIL